MNKTQALELAYTMIIPEFLIADGQDSLNTERLRTEEAIKFLSDAYATDTENSFSFDAVRTLADRNRIFCDELEPHMIGRGNSVNIKRTLSYDDSLNAIAALQKRKLDAVQKALASDKENLALAYLSAKVKGTVLGIDIETTGISPDRSYIINVGYQVIDLKDGFEVKEEGTFFCGLPEIYAQKGVPLEEIHHINWETIKNEIPFRENAKLQNKLLSLMEKYPFLAHNAAFEDSWFMLNLDGYAEGRKAGRIIPVDTREICRKLDPEVLRLPRESAPASLENWARRRHTLAKDEKEFHQGLEDVDLMLRTTVAELKERNLLK